MYFKIIVGILWCAVAGMSLEASSAGAVKQPEPAGEQTPQEKGKEVLRKLLSLHRNGIAADTSESYKGPCKTWSAWVKAERHRLATMSFVNVQRQAVDLFQKSDSLAHECIPIEGPVCAGTQLIEDLEVIAGKKAGAPCLVSSLSLAQSAVGTVSAALLLARPQKEVSILLQRQTAIRALMSHEERRIYLTELYAEFAARERYCLPVLNKDGAISDGFQYGMLLLQLPFLRKLKRFPVVGTANGIMGLYGDLLWASLLAFGTYKLAAYAFHTIRTGKIGREAVGRGLNEAQAAAVSERYEYMMPDMRLFMKLSRSPAVHALIAAGSAGLAAYWLYSRVDSMRAGHLRRQLRWYSLTQAAYGFSSMEAVYHEVKEMAEIRELADCQQLFDFFEKKVMEDPEIGELMRLFRSLPLDEELGSPYLMGYVERAYVLLDEKKEELADLTVAFARLEAYLGCARLMAKERGIDENGFSFAEYASADDPAIFKAEQLWNPFIAPSVAAPNSVSLGGSEKVRNYIISGANAAGKSTLLKSVGIGALLGQTIGIVPARSCTMSVFAVLETYLNITDDIQEGNSLFKKEVMRVAELLKRACDVAGKPVLFIFDEMFSGTTPYEGISCAYAVVESLAQKPQVLSCIATHYMYVTRLARKYSSIANKCVRLEVTGIDEITKRPRYKRTYKVHDGISDQHVALDMLGEEGIDTSIVHDAHKVLAGIEKHGIGHESV